LTVAVTPYLIKPSQDRYGHYWDWFNLRPNKNAPLRWRDTRFVGLTNWVVEREVYPAGKYPKTWNRETFNGESLKTNYTFSVSYSSRTSPVSSLSSIMPDITARGFDYRFEIMRLSSITTPFLSSFIAYIPVSGINVVTSLETQSIIPPITANIVMTIPSYISKYWPGLYNTETDYITAGTRIMIEVPQQRKAYNYLPKSLGYGTTKVNRPSAITTNPLNSATTIQRVTAMNPSYDVVYLDGNRALILFTATLDEQLRKAVYPVSALPLASIIPGYVPGLFFRIYNFDYYTQNAYSFANTFTEYANYRYNTITTSSGTNISTNFFTSPLYASENDLITNQISSINDPITSVRQVIPGNYGSIYCFNSAGDLVKNYTKKFERPESIISDNTSLFKLGLSFPFTTILYHSEQLYFLKGICNDKTVHISKPKKYASANSLQLFHFATSGDMHL